MAGGARSELALGLAAAAAAALVYATSVRHGFVWDDAVVIVGNPALRGDAAALFGAIDTARAVEPTPYYRPLTLLSFLVEERLHGLDPGPMHLLNVLLHAACAFLVLRLLRTLLADRAAALLGALLFAVHPLNAEAVNFLSGGRNTMLACLFSLAALLLHRWSVAGGPPAAVLASAPLFLAGLLSKETALLVLPFIAAVELTRAGAAPPRLTPRAAARLLPYLAGAALYLALRRGALAGAGVQVRLLPGLGERLWANVYVVPRYLLSLAWPPALSPQYFVPQDLGALALPLAAAWLGLGAALGWLLTRGRSRATLLGLAWLAAFWLPVSGLFPIPSGALADRYLYLPAIGLWLVVADQAGRAFPPGHPRRRWAAVAGAALLALLAAAAVARSGEWRSDVALFSAYVRANPGRAFGHHNLGTAYLDQVGDLDAAERELEAALALDPAFPRLRTQLGYVRMVRGDLEGALAHYDAAVRLNPLDAEARFNRALVLDTLVRQPEAAAEYQRFLDTPGGEFPEARARAAARLRELAP